MIGLVVALALIAFASLCAVLILASRAEQFAPLTLARDTHLKTINERLTKIENTLVELSGMVTLSVRNLAEHISRAPPPIAPEPRASSIPKLEDVPVRDDYREDVGFAIQHEALRRHTTNRPSAPGEHRASRPIVPREGE